ncbi:TPA: methylmalonyl Co-A mutase-associated GTPase MeaB [Candidatus Thalassarchaeaceae archaeon]|jgi:LAO/AO transport system kinase|nr:methylmalonyl Co-A mutase-associated GTPase MeaB [Euryarchaeota archaeon]MDG1547935.1 GTP-binding protein [Candidatus Thalassarchaeaceae archaeon]DAC67666.1 MAG TPA: methylmalonyl Co-A mutase-associated GTPase MeaB [Candidatus Poseidoniales archaeon]MBT3846980.1 methylmalonyl Co-A mutase-associated GTPase MeaB [Euryarchaeota archaeon]MBT4475749.1 methylmalonyl Co-A mutase-associated GTPase MeaB [Euryarchaeota archaeon]|tara:strand:- start:12960 stop:13817 length:858 start_codon:yes stop_codon:yes gene_type:complete
MGLIQESINLAISGNRRELARLLSSIESGDTLPLEPSKSWVLGVTGPPGVGKSTLIGRMIDEWVSRGEKVAVLAVDPSSPKSGGALLADRMRMSSADSSKSVFVRSLATRNHPGGLVPFLDSMINLLSLCGWSRIIIETVGSGQSEIRIVAFADRVMLVDGPDRGDIIQAEKAGIMELADLIVINKSDLPNALNASNFVKNSFSYSDKDSNKLVLLTSALNNDGISNLINEIEKLKINNERNSLRMKERLLSAWDYLLLSNPSFNDILLDLESGKINLDEALGRL